MIKTKLIGNQNYEVFERELNNFIKDKKVIDIKYKAIYLPVKMDGASVLESTILDRALVIYEEVDNEN